MIALVIRIQNIILILYSSANISTDLPAVDRDSASIIIESFTAALYQG